MHVYLCIRIKTFYILSGFIVIIGKGDKQSDWVAVLRHVQTGKQTDLHV